MKAMILFLTTLMGALGVMSDDGYSINDMSTLSVVGLAFEVPINVVERDVNAVRHFDSWVADWRSKRVKISYLRTTICASRSLGALLRKSAQGLVTTIEESDESVSLRTAMDGVGTCYSITIEAPTLPESWVIAEAAAATMRIADDSHKTCVTQVSADMSSVKVKNEFGIVRELRVGDAASAAFGVITEIRRDAVVLVELIRNPDQGVFEEAVRIVSKCGAVYVPSQR